MAVRRHAGPKPTKRPHLLDRAVKARPAAVHRRRRPVYRSPLFVALLVGVGGIAVLRATGHLNPSQLVRAASGAKGSPEAATAVAPRRPVSWAEFMQATSRPVTPVTTAPVSPEQTPSLPRANQVNPQQSPASPSGGVSPGENR